MKRTAAILLLCIYSLAYTELYQFLKLPVLVQHFYEHQELAANISLTQFLTLHYGKGHPIDKDHDQDMRLPFKSCSNMAANIPVFASSNGFITLFKPVCTSLETTGVYRETFIKTIYLSSIWQPPKSC